MEESHLIPKNLTYESAKTLQDLEKLEKMEELDTLNQELEYLSSHLRDFKRILKKEKQIRIYNDIQDDDMYKKLNTVKSGSEDDLNQSFDNSSIILDNVNPLESNILSEGIMASSKVFKQSHIIRNKSRSDFIRPSSKSMIFDEDFKKDKPFGRKKSMNCSFARIAESKVIARSEIVTRKGSKSLRKFLVRGIKQNFLMNSGISPEVKKNKFLIES